MYYYGAGKSATTTLFKLCGTDLIQTESEKKKVLLYELRNEQQHYLT